MVSGFLGAHFTGFSKGENNFLLGVIQLFLQQDCFKLVTRVARSEDKMLLILFS